MRRALILLALIPAALAAEPASNAPYANIQLRDPAAEARAKALMESLRCVVCQGQSIADSDASMAGDMRSLVRTRIAAGGKRGVDPPLAGRALRRLCHL